MEPNQKEIKPKIWVGIDPGKSGGIAFIDEENNIGHFPVPLTGTEISIDDWKTAMLFLVREFDIRMCILENVHSIFGTSAKSNFQFGRSLGIIEGILSSTNTPFTMVPPKTWQKLAHQGIPVMKDNKKGMSLLAAQRLFPGNSLTTNDSIFFATKRAKKPHDGIVDAVLMAFYGQQNYI